MGRRSRRSRGRTPEADGEQSSETEGDDDVQRWPSDSAVGPNTAGPATKEEVEAYYGCEVSSAKEYKELQRLEKAYGGQVLRWADEGIPLDAMGDQSKIQRFRARRDSEIPYDIEEFNQDSLDENTGRVARRVRESPDGKTDVPDTVREVISSPGRSLDSSIQRAVEERMGDSLGDVRIHTGPKAAEAADQINARAFTVGNHVAFGAGEYDPESAEGQHVLAHELAHVRQQTGGDLSMLPQEGVQLEIDPDPELEREAEETAQRVMSGGKLGIQKLSDSAVHVQRQVGGDIPLDEFAERLDTVERNPGVSDEEVRAVREVINRGDKLLQRAVKRYVVAGGTDAVRSVSRLEQSDLRTSPMIKETLHLSANKIGMVARVVSQAKDGPSLFSQLPADALASEDPNAVVGLNNRFGVRITELTNLVEKGYTERVRTLLSMDFDGTWSGGSENLRDHIEKHADEWPSPMDQDRYVTEAIKRLNGEKSGTEMYYQPGNQNLVVYDPSNAVVVVGGAPDGRAQTMYRINTPEQRRALRRQIENHWTLIKEI